MISRITPKSIKISSVEKNNFAFQISIRFNFSQGIQQQKRNYANDMQEATIEIENAFIPPVHYPKGILRSKIVHKSVCELTFFLRFTFSNLF